MVVEVVRERERERLIFGLGLSGLQQIKQLGDYW